MREIVAATPRGAGEAICTSKTHNFARRKGKDEEYQTAKPGKLEKLHSPLDWPRFSDDDLARRVAQVELDAKAAEVAAPALATMDGSLHTLPSKPAAGLDDMDGSLYNLRAFG